MASQTLLLSPEHLVSQKNKIQLQEQRRLKCSTKDHTVRAGGQGHLTPRVVLSSCLGLGPCVKGAVAKKTSDLWRHFLFSSEQKSRLPAQNSP